MNSPIRGVGRTVWVATRAMILFTLLLGVLYTAVVTVAGQLVFPGQSNGSMISGEDGRDTGSSLIGQAFVDAEGNPLPQYFQSRPSAAGDGYDAGASGGSNYGPENPDLIAAIAERKAQVAVFNGVAESDVPADAVTASASGLDPHISTAYASIQIARVADARAIPADTVRELVDAHASRAAAGFLGQSTVNVLELNAALDRLEG